MEEAVEFSIELPLDSVLKLIAESRLVYATKEATGTNNAIVRFKMDDQGIEGVIIDYFKGEPEWKRITINIFTLR